MTRRKRDEFDDDVRVTDPQGRPIRSGPLTVDGETAARVRRTARMAIQRQ